MPKRQMNNLRWKAELTDVEETTDADDRSVTKYNFHRILYYEELGVTAQEKYLSQQAKTDVARRIKCRWDKSVTEKMNGVRIGGVDYNITRIYVLADKREMELSLAHVE